MSWWIVVTTEDGGDNGEFTLGKCGVVQAPTAQEAVTKAIGDTKAWDFSYTTSTHIFGPFETRPLEPEGWDNHDEEWKIKEE